MRTIRLFQQVSFCHFSRVALYLCLQGITAHTQTYHRRPYFLHLVHSEVIGGRGLLGEQCCHNLGISHIVTIYQPLCFKSHYMSWIFLISISLSLSKKEKHMTDHQLETTWLTNLFTKSELNCLSTCFEGIYKIHS